MNENNNQSFPSLRKRAEAMLNKSAEQLPDMSTDDIKKLVQELHTHQIELELQNEDLKKAQLELSDVLNKYKDFYNLPPIGYLNLDEKGVIREANLPVCEMFGKGRSLLLNKKFNCFLPSESQDLFYLYWRDLIHKKTSKKLDIKLSSEDNKGAVFARMECVPFVNDKGAKNFKVILFDITDRKALEQKLKNALKKQQTINEELRTANEKLTKTYNDLNESEERFEKIFNNAPDGIHLIDPETKKFIIGNTKFCKMIGYKPEDIKTIRIDDIHSEKDLPFVHEQFKKAVKREIEIAMDIPVKRKDGSILYVDINTFLMNYQNKKCMVGIFRDITERKEFELSLKNEKAYSENLISSMPDGLWVLDEKGITSDINPAMVSMLGYSRDDLIKMSPMQITPDEYAENTKRIINEVFKGNVASGEQEIIRKDCKRIPVSIVAAPIKNHKNKITGAFGIIHDITEIKKKEQLVINTQKMQAVGTLAGGMAHEFNNIIGIMMGYVQLLQDNENLSSNQKESLNLIYKYGEKAAEIIKNILNFSRKENVEMELFDLGSLLKEAVQIIKLIKTHDIKISCDIEKELPLIQGNPTQIQQALINISNNSIQAMEKKRGTLKFTLKLEEDNPYPHSQDSSISDKYLKLCIEDEGIGIPDEIINQVFDPFFSTKEKGKGTGLGLSVVHGIIKNHNAKLSLKSKPKVGTVICIFFPAAIEAPKVGNYVLDSPLHGVERIMIVEDELEFSKILSQSLSKLGYRVSVSSSGKEAFAEIRRNPDKFDIVISDYTMPGTNGIELYKKLCGIRKNFPFIIVSGYMNVDLEKYIKERENLDYLNKPVNITELTNLIRGYFD